MSGSRGWFRRPESDLAERLAALQDELAVERARAERAEQALAEARGPEHILRLAEAEAQAIRSTAARDAAALLERTHAEAESHRHEVAQQLDRRTVESGRRIAAEAEAARQEIERLRPAEPEPEHPGGQAWSALLPPDPTR
jgi:hypothetical protein